jgi:hypothetical protein
MPNRKSSSNLKCHVIVILPLFKLFLRNDYYTREVLTRVTKDTGQPPTEILRDHILRVLKL